MAHIGKPRGKNGRVPVQVRKAGHAPIHRTFAKASDAKRWARDIESKIDRGSTADHREIGATMVRDLLRRFLTDEVPKRRGWRWEKNRILRYLEQPWAWLSLRQDIASALRVWRDDRLRTVTPQSVNRDFNLLGSIFTHAAKEWGIAVANPVHQVKRPTVVGGKREVVWTDSEFESMMSRLGFDIASASAPVTAQDFMPWVMEILRTTGLRLGSVCSIRMDQIRLADSMIAFDPNQVKNGEPFDCPLGGKAKVVLGRLVDLRAGERRLVPFSSDSIGNRYRTFRDAFEAADPTRRKGLRIHDIRHTWTTKTVSSGKVPTVLELMKITGRKDMKSLAVYFNPSAQDLAKMLD